MAKLSFNGPLRHRINAFLSINLIAFRVALGHALGQRMAPDWDISLETGIRFWRRQFTKAMNAPDMATGRAILGALNTMTDDVYEITRKNNEAPRGMWYTPEKAGGNNVILYLHGGGYTFREPFADRFAAMLSHHCQTPLFMPHYRLTPEHPHPAQQKMRWRHTSICCNTISRSTSPLWATVPVGIWH